MTHYMYNWIRLIFRGLAILVILSAVLFLSLARIYNLELSNDTKGDNFIWFYIIAIPLSISFLIAFRHKYIKQITKLDFSVSLVFGGLVMAVFLFFYSYSMCGWSTDKILWESNYDDSQIVEESYGCGTFGSQNRYRTIEKEELFYYFYRIKEVDLNNINTENWKRVNKIIRGA